MNRLLIAALLVGVALCRDLPSKWPTKGASTWERSVEGKTGWSCTWHSIPAGSTCDNERIGGNRDEGIDWCKDPDSCEMTNCCLVPKGTPGRDCFWTDLLGLCPSQGHGVFEVFED